MIKIIMKIIMEITMIIKLVPVITCLGGRFVINCPSAFLQLSEITRAIYPNNLPNQRCDYWIITPNQQKLCIETVRN